MPKSSFVVCAKTDCKWNKEGQCDKSEIFVDQGVMCASYEPQMLELGLGMMGGPDPRSMLVQQMIGGGPAPSLGGGLGPPLSGPEPQPTAAPPPLRF